MTLQQVTALFIGFDVTKFNEPAYRRYQRNVFTEAPDLTTGGTVVTVPPTLIQTLDHYYLVVTSDLPVAALTTGVQMQVALNIASTVTTDKYRYLNAIEPALFRFQLGSTLLHLGGLLLVTLLYFAYVDPHTKRYIRSIFYSLITWGKALKKKRGIDPVPCCNTFVSPTLALPFSAASFTLPFTFPTCNGMPPLCPFTTWGQSSMR